MKSKRIAEQRAMQASRKYAARNLVLVDAFWSIDAETQAEWFARVTANGGHTHFTGSALDVPIPRSRSLAESDEPVDVYVSLSYPLTEAVPEGVRGRNFQARTVLDVCREVRSMYEAIYAEDARLGGLTAEQTREADPSWRLLNRKEGPWIWGHDMSDLAIEFIEFDWKSPTHVHANLFVGS